MVYGSWLVFYSYLYLRKLVCRVFDLNKTKTTRQSQLVCPVSCTGRFMRWIELFAVTLCLKFFSRFHLRSQGNMVQSQPHFYLLFDHQLMCLNGRQIYSNYNASTIHPVYDSATIVLFGCLCLGLAYNFLHTSFILYLFKRAGFPHLCLRNNQGCNISAYPKRTVYICCWTFVLHCKRHFTKGGVYFDPDQI